MNEVGPARGEVWWVDLDPTRGSETSKTRPAVVVSTDAVATLPVRLVVPLTEWKQKHAAAVWRLPVAPTPANGLTKESAADALQVRCVSTDRFKHRMGRLESDILAELSAAIALLVEYE
jgi:mRNA interferase MazF